MDIYQKMEYLDNPVSRLFSALLVTFRNGMECAVEGIKSVLDKYQQTLSDQTGCMGYVGLWAVASNGLVDLL